MTEASTLSLQDLILRTPSAGVRDPPAGVAGRTGGRVWLRR